MHGKDARGGIMSDCPIVFDHLRKEFRNFVAVDDLCLNIRRNSFTGLLGPNGAGKSTSLKIATNLTSPTSGHVYLNDIDVTAHPKRALDGVGTVVETPEFYTYLTPIETFEYIGGLLGMSRESISNEITEILDKVKMGDWADKRICTFSKGMRQRVALGLALMDSPNVIILDEPTSGLDPRGVVEVRDILKNIRDGNRDLTILMSSHMMHEVSDLCDRIAIVNNGRLIVEDDFDSLLKDADTRVLVVRPLNEPDGRMVDEIASLPNVVSAEIDGNSIDVRFKGDMDLVAAFYQQVAGLDFPVCGMSESHNALENRYLELIKESR